MYSPSSPSFGKAPWAKRLLMGVCCGFFAFASGMFLMGAVTDPQWEHVGWGGGGYYWACAYHPTNSNVIYLGGDVSGLYKTTDKGVNWKFINVGLNNLDIHTLTVDPRHPETVFAGTAAGISKSTDGGAHWTFLAQTGTLGMKFSRDGSIQAIAFDPLVDGVVYAGCMNGRVYKSSDSGTTWKQVYQAPSGYIASVGVMKGTISRVFVATSAAGLLKSENGGVTWVAAAGMPLTATSVAFSGNTVYASFGKSGVFKSTDSGATWKAATSGIGTTVVVRQVLVDPSNANRVYCIGNVSWTGYFYRSVDGGTTWTLSRNLHKNEVDDPLLPNEGTTANITGFSSLNAITLNPKNPLELFVAGNWRNAYSSDGGVSWWERVRKADITCVQDIQFCNGSVFAVGMDVGLVVSDNNATNWYALSPLAYNANISGHMWRLFVQNKGATEKILATSTPWNLSPSINQVIISEDGGAKFTTARSGLPTTPPTGSTLWGKSYARSLAVNPSNPSIMYLGMDGNTGGGGVYKSTDGGYHWVYMLNQPLGKGVFNGLAVDPTSPTRVFFGACGTNGGVYRSENDGVWTRVFSGESWIFNIEVSKSGVIYCHGSNLWKSTNHGTTWTKVSNFTDGKAIQCLEIDPRNENTMWISRVTWGSSADGFVMKTTDGGKTWVDISKNIPNRKTAVLRFNAATGDLWAGGVGIYRIKQ